MFVWVGNFYVSVMQERFDEAENWLTRRPVPYGIEADRALLAAQRQPSQANRAELVTATLAAMDQGMGLREGITYLSVAGAADAAFDRLLRQRKATGWRPNRCGTPGHGRCAPIPASPD